MAELSELSSIFTSKAFRQLLERHKEHLQKDVFRFVREQKIVEAYGVVCQYDDIDRVMGLMEKRIVELRKENESG